MKPPSFVPGEEEKEFDDLLTDADLDDADALPYLNLGDPSGESMFSSSSMFMMLALAVVAGLVYRKKRKSNEDDFKP